MARTRLIRDERTPSGDQLLVRALFDAYDDGRILHRNVLIADVTYNFELFGYYGLSLWLVSEAWPLDRVLAKKCRRARRVAIFRVGDLTHAGLGLAPSGRSPHYDATMADDVPYVSVRITASTAHELVDRFLATAYTLRPNEFHDQGQD